MSEFVSCIVLIGVLVLCGVVDVYAQSWEDDPNQHVMVDMRLRLYGGNRTFGSYRPRTTRLLNMLPNESFDELVEMAKEINTQVYPLTSYFDGR